MVASARVLSDPSPALATIRAAKEVEAPDETCSVDPCPTPLAHAVFPSSYDEDGPTSRELLLDDRVERLIQENLELMKERAAMRSIHNQRIDRCNELLAQAREGHQLSAAYVATVDAHRELAASNVSADVFSERLRDLAIEVDAAYRALEDWAAKPL